MSNELAHLAVGVTAEHLRDQLAAHGDADPEAGHAAADRLAFPRWYA